MLLILRKINAKQPWIAMLAIFSCFDNTVDLISTLFNFFRSLWWWPLLVWPRTLWEATTWTCCSLWVSLEPGYTVARILPALDTFSPCSGQQPLYRQQIIWSYRPFCTDVWMWGSSFHVYLFEQLTQNSSKPSVRPALWPAFFSHLWMITCSSTTTMTTSV